MSEYVYGCAGCGKTHFKSDMTTFRRLTKGGPRVAIVEGSHLSWLTADIGLTKEQAKAMPIDQQIALLEQKTGLSEAEIKQKLQELNKQEDDNAGP